MLKTDELTNYNLDELSILFNNRQYHQLSLKFIEIFTFFESSSLLRIQPNQQDFIDKFIYFFLTSITKPDYQPDYAHAQIFIKFNHVISNLAYMSCYKNTDEYLKMLAEDYDKNFVKLMILASARNSIKVDIKKMFDKDYKLASIWYFIYFFLDSFPTELMNANILDHIDKMDERLAFIPLNLNCPYYVVTYYDQVKNKRIKNKINTLIQKSYDIANPVSRLFNKPTRLCLHNKFYNPDFNSLVKKNKIAIVSHKWYKDSAIYKSCFEFINHLSRQFDLTLIHLGPPNPDIDTALFKDIKSVEFNIINNAIDLNVYNLLPCDYTVCIYLDAGISIESLYLSNLRLAPVQVITYGNPVSTFGSEIDYCIGGIDTEIIDDYSDNYSERLVLIPGAGADPVYPVYKKKNIPKSREDFIINCSWGINKFNYNLLKCLKTIIEKANKKILFRFSGSFGLNRFNRYLPFKKELGSILGEFNIDLLGNTPYDQYMSLMEEGDISIEAYPFGGYNSFIDSIYLGKPIVAFEGNKACNKIAAALLRKLNLEELIANDESSYIEKTVNLINDDDYRLSLCNKIQNLDLDSKLFNTSEPEYFKMAIDYLIKNHYDLCKDESKKPVIIARR